MHWVRMDTQILATFGRPMAMHAMPNWLTDTAIAGFELSLRDIVELLWWFELGLTDHGIAIRTEGDYKQPIVSSGTSVKTYMHLKTAVFAPLMAK